MSMKLKIRKEILEKRGTGIRSGTVGAVRKLLIATL